MTSTFFRSAEIPALEFPSAISHPDMAITWHCGNPLNEHRSALASGILLDMRQYGVVEVEGKDAPEWLNSLLAQRVVDMSPRTQLRRAYVLDVHGHIEYDTWVLRSSPTAFLLLSPRYQCDALTHYLTSMVFWSQVKVTPLPHHATIALAGPYDLSIFPQESALCTPPESVVSASGCPRGLSLTFFVGESSALQRLITEAHTANLTLGGRWVWDALRVDHGLPQMPEDMDERSLPHEYDSVGDPDEGCAASVTKGCYRGQETVAKIHNVGLPPRRQVVLFLDGSSDARPEPGTPLTLPSLTGTPKTVGRIGTVAEHTDNGPVALGVVKRTIDDDTDLEWATESTWGRARIYGDLSVHPQEHRSGREAVQRFRKAMRGQTSPEQ